MVLSLSNGSAAVGGWVLGVVPCEVGAAPDNTAYEGVAGAEEALVEVSGLDDV